MTAPAPAFSAWQIPDLFAVVGVLALVLLLLAALAEQGGGDGSRLASSALLEQPERAGGCPHAWRFGDSRQALSRSLWLVQPGEVVVEAVSPEARAEALEILEILRALDALFPDHRDRAGTEGGS
jgi:hypothetical protein